MRTTGISSSGSGPAYAAMMETTTDDDWRRRQAIYSALCVVGAALPLSRFLPWLAEHGPDAQVFFDELFTNRISSFFAWDVLVSATVVLAFLALDGGGLPRAHRVLVAVATCSVGVSLGLPLYLLLRERQTRQSSTPAPRADLVGKVPLCAPDARWESSMPSPALRSVESAAGAAAGTASAPAMTGGATCNRIPYHPVF